MDDSALLRLLADVNHFLCETLAEEELSAAAEEEKESLIREITPHLSPSTPAMTPPPYLDMNGGSRSGVVAVEEYVDSDATGALAETEAPCYEEFPSEADGGGGGGGGGVCGPLVRWERRFLLGHAQRCWATVSGGRLLVFPGRGPSAAAKPSLALCLAGYRARPACSSLVRASRKRDAHFEIVCPGKKTYQFIAQNAKEMKQWVAAICLAGEQQPSPVSPNDNQELYDDVNAKPANNHEHEEIYHVISDVSGSDSVTTPSRKPVPLPTCRSPEQNSVYDDVSFRSEESTYYNLVGQGYRDSGPYEEEIYDDIGNFERVPSARPSPTKETSARPSPTKETSRVESSKPSPTRETNSGSQIQQLIQKMEKSFSNRKLPLMKQQIFQHVKVPTEVDTGGELYEPVEQVDKQTTSQLAPQLPPRTHSAYT